MANEMTVYKAVTTAGQAIASMVKSIKVHKSVRKQDAFLLQEQLYYIKVSCRAKGYGELTRLSINEMEKTMNMIMQKNLSGHMYDMCMDLLNMQYQALRQNLQKYMMY